jgi:DNA-3-methyladenine glycosylase
MRLTKDFFCRDVLEVAPDLLGKKLVRNTGQSLLSFMITEVEAYRGEEDEACHARFGQTRRNRVMYESGGLVYVYLVYGMYWMFNIVTGQAGVPQAVLIRGISGHNGPGKLTRSLEINKNLYGEDLTQSNKIWLENHSKKYRYLETSRIGIDYAAEPWKSMPWRYILT